VSVPLPVDFELTIKPVISVTIGGGSGAFGIAAVAGTAAACLGAVFDVPLQPAIKARTVEITAKRVVRRAKRFILLILSVE
jgi:hypothetical protein